MSSLFRSTTWRFPMGAGSAATISSGRSGVPGPNIEIFYLSGQDVSYKKLDGNMKSLHVL